MSERLRLSNLRRAMKVKCRLTARAEIRRHMWRRRTRGPRHRLACHFLAERHCRGVDLEPTRWDPKDGELCLARMKPEETLVEVRRDSDVQIDRLSWV